MRFVVSAVGNHSFELVRSASFFTFDASQTVYFLCCFFVFDSIRIVLYRFNIGKLQISRYVFLNGASTGQSMLVE